MMSLRVASGAVALAAPTNRLLTSAKGVCFLSAVRAWRWSHGLVATPYNRELERLVGRKMWN